ncbi:XRE family transcriptional regulator, partial [Methylovulum psychrotolerans]
LGDRIRSERKRFRLNQTDFASIGGVGKNMQYKYEQNKGVPDATYLINLSNHGVDINWVLFGSLNHEEIKSITSPMALSLNNKDFIGIPLYAREEGNRCEENELVYFPISWFIKNNLPLKEVVVVINQGDAMSPQIKDNDWVLADTQRKTIGNGCAIVFRLGECVLVNNLQSQGNALLVSGLNRTFPPYTLDVSDNNVDFEIIGRVIASLNKW